MIARAMYLMSGATALALVLSVPAQARPLLLSDLPPDVRELPNAQAGVGGSAIASNFEQVGEASWYGAEHAGRRTSSGTRFDPRGMTAAHATLPLGSQVRVIREDTGQSIVVTVTDRIGTRRRVLDLSRGAAEQLGIRQAGIALVRLVSVDNETFVPAPAIIDPEPSAAPAPRRARPNRPHAPQRQASVQVRQHVTAHPQLHHVALHVPATQAAHSVRPPAAQHKL